MAVARGSHGPAPSSAGGGAFLQQRGRRAEPLIPGAGAQGRSRGGCAGVGGRRGVKVKTLCTARGPANHSVLLLLCREFRPRREKLRGPGQRGGPRTPAHSSQGRPGLPAPRLQSHEGQGGHSRGGQTTGSFRGLSIRPLCPWQRDHSSSCRTQAGWGALGVRGGQLSCCCGGPDGRGLRRQSRAETEPSGWGPGLGGGQRIAFDVLGSCSVEEQLGQWPVFQSPAAWGGWKLRLCEVPRDSVENERTSDRALGDSTTRTDKKGPGNENQEGGGRTWSAQCPEDGP